MYPGSLASARCAAIAARVPLPSRQVAHPNRNKRSAVVWRRKPLEQPQPQRPAVESFLIDGQPQRVSNRDLTESDREPAEPGGRQVRLRVGKQRAVGLTGRGEQRALHRSVRAHQLALDGRLDHRVLGELDVEQISLPLRVGVVIQDGLHCGAARSSLQPGEDSSWPDPPHDRRAAVHRARRRGGRPPDRNRTTSARPARRRRRPSTAGLIELRRQPVRLRRGWAAVLAPAPTAWPDRAPMRTQSR